MTARQPRTPQEAAMLDPTGLMSFPAPTRRRGLFGGSMGRGPMSRFIPEDGAQMGDPAAMQPPPISSAPPPPTDWRKAVGSDLMAQLPQTMLGDTLPPAPPMRGGIMGSPSRAAPTLGMFGNVAGTGLPPMAGSDKIANRGAPLPMDANGDGKKEFDWRMLAGIVGDGLLGAVGQNPIYGPNMWKMRQQQAEHQDRMTQMREQARLKYAEPDYSTVGNRRYRYDPGTGEATPLFVAPTEAEDYAGALGAEPGTPEYDVYLQDYILRHSGPTATDNAMEEEDNRQTNREQLEGVRQRNRLGVENVRQGNRLQLRDSPTYRDANPRPRSAGGPRTGGTGGTGGVQEGRTATGPGGAKMIFRGGKWVPLK